MASKGDVLVSLFPEDRGVHATLLRVGELTVLLDCGWVYPFSSEDLLVYDKILEGVDVLVISHADLSFCGAMFYCLIKNKKLQVMIPEGLSYLVKLALFEAKQNLSSDYYSDVSPTLYYPINDDIEKDLKQRVRETAFKNTKSLFGDKVRFACIPSGSGILGAIWCIWINGVSGCVLYAPRINTINSGVLHTIVLDSIMSVVLECGTNFGDATSLRKNNTVALIIAGCEKSISRRPDQIIQQPYLRRMFRDSIKNIIKDCVETGCDAMFVCDGTCRGVETLFAINELLVLKETENDDTLPKFSAYLVGSSADTLLRYIPGALQKTGDQSITSWSNSERTGVEQQKDTGNNKNKDRSGSYNKYNNNVSNNGCYIKPLESITSLHALSTSSSMNINLHAGKYVPKIVITTENTLSSGITLSALKILASNTETKRGNANVNKTVKMVSIGLSFPKGSVSEFIFNSASGEQIEVPVQKFNVTDIPAKKALEMYDYHSTPVESREQDRKNEKKDEDDRNRDGKQAGEYQNSNDSKTSQSGISTRRRNRGKGGSGKIISAEEDEVEKQREIRGDISRAFDFIIAGSSHYRETSMGSVQLMSMKYSPIFPLPMGINDSPYIINPVYPAYRRKQFNMKSFILSSLSRTNSSNMSTKEEYTIYTPNIVVPCLHTLPPDLSRFIMPGRNKNTFVQDYHAFIYGIDSGMSITRPQTLKRLKAVSTTSVSMKQQKPKTCKPPSVVSQLVTESEKKACVSVELNKDTKIPLIPLSKEKRVLSVKNEHVVDVGPVFGFAGYQNGEATNKYSILTLNTSDDMGKEKISIKIQANIIMFPGCLTISAVSNNLIASDSNEEALNTFKQFIDSISPLCTIVQQNTSMNVDIESYDDLMSEGSIIDNKYGTICVILGSSKDIGMNLRQTEGWQLFDPVKPIFIYDSSGTYTPTYSDPLKQLQFNDIIENSLNLNLERTGRKASISVKSLSANNQHYSFVLISSESIFRKNYVQPEKDQNVDGGETMDSSLAHEVINNSAYMIETEKKGDIKYETSNDIYDDQGYVICSREEIDKRAFRKSTGMRTYYEIEERVFNWPTTMIYDDGVNLDESLEKVNQQAEENLNNLTRELSRKAESTLHRVNKIKPVECIKTSATVDSGIVNATVTISDPSIDEKVRNNPEMRKAGLKNLIGAFEVRRTLHNKTGIY